MVDRPAKIIQMVDRQVRNRLSSVRGVSEAIWHKVVAPLSKCEKNRVIIRNELGPGRSLEYHCHSNGKDQGVQFLKFNEERNFEFVDHFFGKKNKVNCVLRQGLWMQSSSRDFEAYHTIYKHLSYLYDIHILGKKKKITNKHGYTCGTTYYQSTLGLSSLA
ncbi:unnamed protein product [Brassica oleracea]